jgi:hypothetical protein
VRAYRLGHRAALDVVLDEIRAADLDPRLSLDVFDRMAATSFDYIDWISQRVIGTYQGERERWVENRNSLRALQVREILAGVAGTVRSHTRRIVRCSSQFLVHFGGPRHRMGVDFPVSGGSGERAGAYSRIGQGNQRTVYRRR